MKKSTVFRLFALLLSAVMLSAAAIPAAASDTKEYSDAVGYIVCGDEGGFDDSVDLTKIRLEARAVVGRTANDLAEESIEIYPDESGKFTFPRDAEMYMVKLDQSTLPDGYGILSSNHRILFRDTATVPFKLYHVARIETEQQHEYVYAYTYNTDGNYIDTNCRIIPDEPIWAEEIAQPVGPGRQYETKLDYIDAITEKVFTGTAVCGDVSVTYRYGLDYSMATTADKVDMLYEVGAITEEERVGMYCDILIAPSKYSLYDGCEIYYPSVLSDYARDHSNIPSELAEKLKAAEQYWEDTFIKPYQALTEYVNSLTASRPTLIRYQASARQTTLMPQDQPIMLHKTLSTVTDVAHSLTARAGRLAAIYL